MGITFNSNVMSSVSFKAKEAKESVIISFLKERNVEESDNKKPKELKPNASFSLSKSNISGDVIFSIHELIQSKESPVLNIAQEDVQSEVSNGMSVEEAVQKDVLIAQEESSLNSMVSVEENISQEDVLATQESTFLNVMLNPKEESQAVLATLEEAASQSKNERELSDEEKAHVAKLEKIDMQIKTHEHAHRASGGKYTKPASYSYIEGPDGGKYAVAGEVAIDISSIKGDPEATIAKMNIVKKAALAPASPSSADRAVASKAASIQAEARKELMMKRQEESRSEENYSSLIMQYGKETYKNNVSHSLIAEDV